MEIVRDHFLEWKGRSAPCLGIKKAGRETLETRVYSQFLLLCSISFVSQPGSKEKTKIDNKKAYIHIYRNLYLILTPLLEGQTESKIEDLFDSSTLSIEINGKSFNRSDEKVTETTYSKAVFAREVVEKRASSINFEGFLPLLDRIENVIDAHYAQRKDWR